MTTLLQLLTGQLEYSNSWAVYAEKVNGKFTPDSKARFGQTVFENGGLLDDCELFDNNESICDSRENYCDFDAYFYEEWALDYIQQMQTS